MKTKHVGKQIIIGVLLLFSFTCSWGQSNIKEGNNHFAKYTKSGDIKDLLEARKYADLAYKLKRDSTSYNNTLLKALVYSSLSVADSNRSQKYEKDPIDEAEFMLGRLTDNQLNLENEAKLNNIKKRLATGYLIKARRALEKKNYEEAYQLFSKVQQYNNEVDTRHNLALLSEQLGKNDEAIAIYSDFMKNKSLTKPGYVLTLARLYL